MLSWVKGRHDQDKIKEGSNSAEKRSQPPWDSFAGSVNHLRKKRGLIHARSEEEDRGPQINCFHGDQPPFNPNPFPPQWQSTNKAQLQLPVFTVGSSGLDNGERLMNGQLHSSLWLVEVSKTPGTTVPTCLQPNYLSKPAKPSLDSASVIFKISNSVCPPSSKGWLTGTGGESLTPTTAAKQIWWVNAAGPSAARRKTKPALFSLIQPQHTHKLLNHMWHRAASKHTTIQRVNAHSLEELS